jgi:hypothetical protein
MKSALMTKFNTYLRATHGSGLPESDIASYDHPQSLQPWEKKALVFVSPKSGTGDCQKLFNTHQQTLLAAGFK